MAEAVKMPAGPQVREWAARNRFSEWMVGRFLAVAQRSGLGPSDRLQFLEGLRRKAPSYIRCNPLRATPAQLATRLRARGFQLEATQMDPQVLHVVDAPISQGATLEHLLGWSSPQDLASAAAPMALGARRGETVVDLAAAPGMKTIHIAGDMDDSGALVAVEPEAQRMRALRMNLERAGASCTLLRQHAAQEIPGQSWADRVLVDAPCTGEGTLPRDKTRRHGRIEETDRLSALQEHILDAADRILRPGGTLVYATCTFAPEENEVQVARMMRRGYAIEPTGLETCEGVPLGRGITEWPGSDLPEEMGMARRFFPGVHPTLGFFVARLRKEGP